MNHQPRRAKKPRSLRDPGYRAAFTPSSGVLAAAVGIALAGTGHAEQVDDIEAENQKPIEVIEVYGEPGAVYKARRSGDFRRIGDLAETPQTITVLTQSQLLDSGRTDLDDILAAQAGITLGTGENGNAFGDRYVIRGHEARSDVFVDGVRDPGMTTRESFAMEQIEITKGPSSTFAGRGSTGGAVNGITKQASVDNSFAFLGAGFGTDEYRRITVDVNQPLGENYALRANLLSAEEDVPDRAPAGKERKGALVSLVGDITERFSAVADVYHLEADDIPDLGSYFDRDRRKPVEDMFVYVQKDSDFLDTNVTTGTLKLVYEFDGPLTAYNISRYGETDNGYVTTGARGSTRDVTDPVAPGAPTVTLSSHQGWQEVEYFVNQLNFVYELDAGFEHRFVAGIEYSDEEVLNGVYDLVNTAPTNCIVPGRGGVSDSYCATDANNEPYANVNTLLGREVSKGGSDSWFRAETISAFLMDTVTFNEQWSGFFGLRYDDIDYRNSVVGRGAVEPTEYAYQDGYWNGHAGLVRTIGDNGNVYLTYSTSTNINGGESDVGGSCGYGGLCGTPDQVRVSDPEHMKNFELGTKFNLFDDRLLATAALFQMTKSDVMESVGDAYSSIGTLNTGENRVRGVEFSLAGNVTEDLSVQFGAAFMDSEVTKSFNPENVGLALSNFADNSVYLQGRYQVTPKFSFGGALTYQSEMYGGQPDSAAGYDDTIGDYSVVVPSFTVLDLFVNYDFTDSLRLRANVGNVTDENYWTAAYRSGSFMYIGDARNAQVSLTWSL